jgi:DNA-binding transcriptional LysR family regulator
VDRIDAMIAFVTAVDASGFSAAARQLGRSPASVTRAVAFLEDLAGSQLLRRTTRSLRLTDEGTRYLAACRRILGEFEQMHRDLAGERAAPRGTLTVTAPVAFGRLHIRPLVDEFLAAHDGVRVLLILLDRLVNLIDEGVDAAVRIAHMPDSSLLAVKVGEVRRVLCASPAYLARRSRPRHPSDLAAHDCISFSQVTPTEHWAFAGGANRPRHVKVQPRLTVNTADAAIGSVLEGHGVTCALSYQVEAEVRAGRLVELLKPFEPPPLPVHIVYPAASVASAKVRAFVDLAASRLRSALTGARAGERRASAKARRRG